MIVAATLAVIIWGALAFGAVYRWAYVPLLIACALVGAAGLLAPSGAALPKGTRAVLIALLAVLTAVLLQLVPLPAGLLRTLSPGTDAFLRTYDIAYAVDGLRHPLSINPSATGLGLAFAAAFVLFLSGLLRAFSRSGVHRLVTAIVIFGVVLALIGIVQKTLLGDHTYMGMKIYGFWTPESKLVVPFGPYVNRNHFAGWMLMAIPLTIGYVCAGFEEGARHVRPGWRNRLLWFSSPEGGKSLLAAFAVVVMALSLVMSMSRSGMAAFAVTALFVGSQLVMALRTKGTRITAALLFVALIAVPVMWLGPESTAERFSTDSRGSLQMRLHVWRDTREIIRDFPVAGTGLNTFGTATVLYQTGSRDVTFQEAHSDYLQLLAEGGILIALPAGIAIVLLILAVRHRFREDGENRRNRWIRFGAVSGLLAIALQSLVEFSLQMPGNAALCVVLVAVAMHVPPVRAGRSAALEAV